MERLRLAAMDVESLSSSRGELLWQPTLEEMSRSNLARYLRWLEVRRGMKFAGYQDLRQWSVSEVESFWESIAEFFEVRFHRPAESVLTSYDLPGSHWFPGATLNYAEHALRHPTDGVTPAIIFQGESVEGRSECEEISRAELKRQVAAVADALKKFGVRPGDRVCGYLSNLPQTVVAFLASASIGAIWSVCPSELSSRGVIERFHQIEPKVIFATTSYRYGGKVHDRSAVLAEIVEGLPTIQHLILIAGPGNATSPAWRNDVKLAAWTDLLAGDPPELIFEAVPFEHPLWILYSSGTTGAPKAIVQGHGGILLEHLKTLSLHFDLRAGDRFFWYTTAGWMMWNMVVSGLLLPDVTVVLYDGSPKYPNFSALWDLVEELGVTFFGTSAPYLLACMKEGVTPSRGRSFQKLRAIGSTGAPLPVEGFRWVYREVKSDLLLGSASGGTDVCTAFVLCNPLLPVHAGELQCRGLGGAIEA